MNNLIALTYKGYAIEPLIYPFVEPKQSKRLRVRRYRAGVRVINIETQDTQTATLPTDFEFFGDARRAAEAHARKMIDNPEDANTGDVFEAAPAVVQAAPAAASPAAAETATPIGDPVVAAPEAATPEAAAPEAPAADAAPAA